VVCLHGIAQHGGIFAGLGERLAAGGRTVVALDLRGHGASLREPPWNTATHVADALEAVATLGVERATWVGHSFGGRVAAALASEAPEITARLALLDPALEVAPEKALRSAEIERLDWSFVTPDGALNALLSNLSMVAPSHELVAEYARADVSKGPDGRYRFSFSPAAAVAAWSEAVLPAPPIARLPTLLLHPVFSPTDPQAQGHRYRDALGDLLKVVEVPNGHNVLWESPEQTIAAIEEFVAGSD
jgi:pimeloyl-ACP methyl ester carboxylesterase